MLVADVERRLATLPDPRRYGARALLICSRRGDPAVLEQALEGFGDGVVAVADHHSFARLAVLRERSAHVLVLDPPAHPEELAALAAAGGRVQIAAHESEAVFARACVEADALRSRHGRALARRRAGCGHAARGVARARRLARRAAARRPRRRGASRHSPRAGWSSSATQGLRQLAVAGKSDLAASPAYALHEGRRTRALAWLDALLAGRPAHPAAAA